MFTKQRAIEKLKELGMPEVYVRLFEGKDIPESFDIICGVPEELYLCKEKEQKELIPEGYEPLWDDGNFDAIYCYVYSDRSIRKLFVEGGEKTYISFMHYVASLIVRAWELEWDSELRTYAAELGFQYLDEVISFIERKHRDIGIEQFEVELAKLIDVLVQKA